MQEEMFGDEKKRRKVIVKKGKCSAGTAFENVVRALLESHGWHVVPKYPCGHKPGTRNEHVVDLYATKDEIDLLVSCKSQDSKGTAYEKLPWAYMCLLNAVNTCLMDRGYLVLHGEEVIENNVFKDPYQYELEPYMTLSSKIVVCSFQEFSRKANRGEL